MTERLFYEVAQVRPSGLIVYTACDPPPDHSRNKILKTNTYTGRVTKGAEKRIRQTINIFLLKSEQRTIYNPVIQCHQPFRLAFATLTISAKDMINHREAYKKGLEPMLRKIRREIGGLYVWKAELQERGQIHWHITINQFVHFQWLKDSWNNIQSKAGWLTGYIDEHGHMNANSTDIHAVWKVKRIDLYLSKYMAKSDPTKAIKGKVWGCSQELMGAKYYSFAITPIEATSIDQYIEEGATLKRTAKCAIISSTEKQGLLIPANHRQPYKNWKG